MMDFKINEKDRISTGFKAPDDYFATLADRISLPEPATNVVPLYRKKPVWMGIAASFVTLMGLGIFFSQDAKTNAAPNEDDIQSYLVYNTNVSAYDIGQHLDEQDIQTIENDLAISNESIESYLLYNDTSE
nr:hypothetical protein [uncultured Flavobacterium sp.]